MKIWTYITILAVVILGVSCSSCKNSKETSAEKEVLNPYEKLSKSKKLPRGTVLVNLKYDWEEFISASDSFNAKVTKVLRRGQEAPIISNDEKLTIEFSAEENELIKNINDESKVLIKTSGNGKKHGNKQIWKIISVK